MCLTDEKRKKLAILPFKVYKEVLVDYRGEFFPKYRAWSKIVFELGVTKKIKGKMFGANTRTLGDVDAPMGYCAFREDPGENYVGIDSAILECWVPPFTWVVEGTFSSRKAVRVSKLKPIRVIHDRSWLSRKKQRERKKELARQDKDRLMLS